MKNETSQPPRRWRLIVAIAAGILVVLELIFTLFRIPGGGRPFEYYDITMILSLVILLCAWPRVISDTRTFAFTRLPWIHKVCTCIVCTAMVVKGFYFLGWFVAFCFK